MTTTFDTEQFTLIYGDGVENGYWTLARNEIIYKSIKKAGLAGVPIIEVGCGRGIVIKSLLQKKVDCFGVELAEINALSGLDNKVVTGKDALDFDENFRQKFKAIMLLDVIEHIENDYDFIQKLLKAYSNVEYLIIAVPARKEIWSNFDEFYHHFRRYDLKMMGALIDKLSFEILLKRYFFNMVYLMILLQDKLHIKRKVESNPPKSFISKMLNRIIASCFVFEFMIMPGNLYGSSIMCIARKKK